MSPTVAVPYRQARTVAHGQPRLAHKGGDSHPAPLITWGVDRATAQSEGVAAESTRFTFQDLDAVDDKYEQTRKERKLPLRIDLDVRKHPCKGRVGYRSGSVKERLVGDFGAAGGGTQMPGPGPTAVALHGTPARNDRFGLLPGITGMLCASCAIAILPSDRPSAEAPVSAAPPVRLTAVGSRGTTATSAERDRGRCGPGGQRRHQRRRPRAAGSPVRRPTSVPARSGGSCTGMRGEDRSGPHLPVRTEAPTTSVEHRPGVGGHLARRSLAPAQGRIRGRGPAARVGGSDRLCAGHANPQAVPGPEVGAHGPVQPTSGGPNGRKHCDCCVACGVGSLALRSRRGQQAAPCTTGRSAPWAPPQA